MQYRPILGDFHPCIDQSWAIFHPLYRPYMGDISQQKRPSDESLFLVPRAGVEPARIAPLVFETSASTDSAIWAKKRDFLQSPGDCYVAPTYRLTRAEKGGFEPPVRLPVRQFSKLLV